MMNWIKRGLVYSPPYDGSWKDNSALTPTPILLNKSTIRVFCGFRNIEGISRIGYVDVDANDPTIIKGVSNKPILDIGIEGAFDDNGVILGDIIKKDDHMYMYYVGFQLVNKVKFLAFSGLAISVDNGSSFERNSVVPILERANEGYYIRAIHSVYFHEGKFKIWYSVGNTWETIKGNKYPNYDINYIESTDGINFSSKGVKCIENNIENKEYRVGRPRVFIRDNVYYMHYTYGTLDGRYEFGLGISYDGIKWKRQDKMRGLNLSVEGWDSRHICYPAVIDINGKTFMFYNGNDMGIDGFGVAELEL